MSKTPTGSAEHNIHESPKPTQETPSLAHMRKTNRTFIHIRNGENRSQSWVNKYTCISVPEHEHTNYIHINKLRIKNVEEDFHPAPWRPRPQNRAAAPQALKFASKSEFLDFFHVRCKQRQYFMKFLKFWIWHRALILENNLPRFLFWDTASESQSPAHISRQIDKRISKMIVGILNKKWKRYQRAQDFVKYLLYPLCRPKLSTSWFWRWFPLPLRWPHLIRLASPLSFCYKTTAFSSILAGPPLGLQRGACSASASAPTRAGLQREHSFWVSTYLGFPQTSKQPKQRETSEEHFFA